jgi:hypothetical protein
MKSHRTDHVTPLYPQKLELTSPTSASPSVGIVRLQTEATEFSLAFVTWSAMNMTTGSFLTYNFRWIVLGRVNQESKLGDCAIISQGEDVTLLEHHSYNITRRGRNTVGAPQLYHKLSLEDVWCWTSSTAVLSTLDQLYFIQGYSLIRMTSLWTTNRDNIEMHIYTSQ